MHEITERILNASTLTSHGHIQGRRLMLDILEAGLQAADPYHAMHRLMRRTGDTLTFGGDLFTPSGSPRSGEENIDLRKTGRIYVFGAGKGIQGVAKAVEDVLGDRLTGGHVIDKQGGTCILDRVEVTFGAHPIPDEACVAGCRRIIEMAGDLRPEDLVITMVGNGVSSLLTLPADGVSLEDIRQTTHIFQIERGGPTFDLIPIRNHLDQMKGGQFSRYLQPARAIHIIAFRRLPYQEMMVSPMCRWLHTLPDETTYDDAVQALEKWDVWDVAPASVRDYLTRADRAGETLKIDEFEKMNSRIFCIFPDELGMVPTARKRAEELGFTPHTLFDNYTMLAEASQVGKVVANLAKHSEADGDPFEPPCALFSHGELLVTVGKEQGMGGRNQEYALSAAEQIAGCAHVVMGSVDSDGTDGPGHQFVEGYDEIPVLTGAIVDGTTAQRAHELGIDLRDTLKRHDTSPALFQIGDGIVATPSMSMGDLCVTLILSQRP